MTDISQENADIIGEIANICIGNAATTLSLILGKSTNITAPNVEVLKKLYHICETYAKVAELFCIVLASMLK